MSLAHDGDLSVSLTAPRRYISRASPKDDNRHVILGTQWYKPRDFAVQMNVNLANGWGIVRTIVDLVMKQGEGKFCLIRDPNSVSTSAYHFRARALSSAFFSLSSAFTRCPSMRSSRSMKQRSRRSNQVMSQTEMASLSSESAQA